jgi:hypothetical protein
MRSLVNQRWHNIEVLVKVGALRVVGKFAIDEFLEIRHHVSQPLTYFCS